MKITKDLEITRDDLGDIKGFVDEVITEIKEDAIPLLIDEFKNEFKRLWHKSGLFYFRNGEIEG